MATQKTELINKSGAELPETLMLKAAEIVLSTEGGKDTYELGILCTDSIEMRRLNRIYRGKDSSTDVLSFETTRMPLEHGRMRPESIFCDIVIDINQISAQKGTNSFESELLKVLIHGLMHICGYDHMTETDRKVMENKEDYYIRKLTGAN